MDNENFMSAKQELIEVFRNELTVLRAKARVSQEIVAEKIGISRQTYSGIETANGIFHGLHSWPWLHIIKIMN